MTTLNYQSTLHEQSLTFNTVAHIFLFKDKYIPTLTYNVYSQCQITSQHYFWKMKNSVFNPCLDELFSLLNNTMHQMHYLVCTAGRYRAMSIFGRVHTAFFNCCQYDAMIYMLDEVFLARMMTTLDLKYEKSYALS